MFVASMMNNITQAQPCASASCILGLKKRHLEVIHSLLKDASMFSCVQLSQLNFNIYRPGVLYGMEPNQLSRATGASVHFTICCPL